MSEAFTLTDAQTKVIEEAASTPAPESSREVAAYGKKYEGLRQEIIQNATALAEKYESLAKRYMDIAAEIRRHGDSTADQHIDDLIGLDQAEEAVARHFKKSESKS